MGGVKKALLRIHGQTIIEMAASVLSRVFSEIFIITNSPEDFGFLGFPMHRDLIPGKGSLGGLYTGLSQCAGNWAFLVACDMPFLNAKVIEHMVQLTSDADVVIPRISGMLEPLHAIYSKACLPHIEKLLAEGDLKILNFLDKVKINEVCEEELAQFDPELRFIINLNTPQDLENARRIAAGSSDQRS
ncbi:MAG: molybdenum cofactor guanylyltransferase [Desulfomonile tiedjei]|uniref:Molybdenum cofactor guanylyltransferase n=1 Tax=Desulfomonile tiedjei TaxID=2358 RepID=A0A9D6Z343_9BACT|nr:molybdenum cofactor guanylyltransferase [Desulfomonile tiedjei]